MRTHRSRPSIAAWTARLAPAAVALAALAALWPCLQNGFVYWDDDQFIVNNLHIRGLGWPHWRWMFTTFFGGVYQPLTWLGFAVIHRWGPGPFGYHLANLTLHAVNAVIFYFVALRLLESAPTGPAEGDRTALCVSAAVAATFFAVHPLRVESVAWAYELRDVLSGTFYLSALLLYLAGRRALALIVFAFSLLAKAAGVGLPIVLVVLDVYPLRRLAGGPRRWSSPAARRILLEKIPFLALSVAAGVVGVRAQAVGGNLWSLERHGFAQRCAQAFFGLAFYLWKTMLPRRLLPLYELPAHMDPLAWPYLLSGAAVLAISVGFIGLRRRWPAGLAAWVCYVATLAPMLGVAQAGLHIAADRYTYLSCLGWAVLAGGAFLTALRSRDRLGATPFALTLILAAGCLTELAALARRQTRIWRDSESLWGYVLSINPELTTAHVNLGSALWAQGKSQEAIAHYRRVLAIDSNYVEARNNLGVALAGQGKLGEAIAQYREALRIYPDYADAHDNLGVALAARGRLAEAASHYREALKIKPDFVEAYDNLGIALALQDKPEQALAQFTQALRINPDSAQAHFNIGLVLAGQGRLEESVSHFRESLRIHPNDEPARANLERVLRQMRR